ncbi:MAG: outer membrane protein assembly factor BamD [candidate division NC10 bacterium]|nr:outer membrane protein assembly factor BamD [candidate division NC10 bacterium]
MGNGTRAIWWAILLLLLLCSCFGPEKKPVLSDAQLLQQAEEALAAKKYEKAQELLKKLMAEYPASEWIPRAQLVLARSYYEQKKYPEAKAEYQKFLDLHPRHRMVDEAHYYLGLAHFAEISTIDRDQSPARRALAEFQALLREAPDSRYAPEAQEKIKVCQEKLAGHEFFVGHFYFRRGKYHAACGRFKYLLSHYPETRSEEKALYYLGESYFRLQDKEEATRTFLRLLERYPDSDYLSEVRLRLAQMRAP